MNLAHHCCGKLLNRQPLMLCITCSQVILRYDLDFVLHRCPVLIQVLGTSLLFINLFKSHSGTLHFGCEQTGLRDCPVFVLCLGQWVSALGINTLENIIQFFARAPLLFSYLLCPHAAGWEVAFPPCWSQEGDPLLPCTGKNWGLVLPKSAWKNIVHGEAAFHPNINRVACPRISSWSKSCSEVESPKYQ